MELVKINGMKNDTRGKGGEYDKTEDAWPTQFSSVQSLSCVQLFVTLWTAACQASLSITNS